VTRGDGVCVVKCTSADAVDISCFARPQSSSQSPLSSPSASSAEWPSFM
jgi:hypothetical protein